MKSVTINIQDLLDQDSCEILLRETIEKKYGYDFADRAMDHENAPVLNRLRNAVAKIKPIKIKIAENP